MISFIYKKTKTFLPLFLGILFTLGGTAKAQSDRATYQKNLTYQQITVKSEKNISLKFKQKPIAEALEAIAKKVDAGLYFNASWLPEKTISLALKNVTLGEALRAVLKGTALEAYASGRNILLRKKEIKNKPVKRIKMQVVSISGTVTDAETGETLPGTNVKVKGTTTGTSTDVNGNYKLTVKSLQGTLVVSFIGYQTQEIPINGRTNIDVALEPSMSSLDELVVTGAGIATERRKLGNTIESVNTEDLNNVAISEPIQMLSGRVSGLSAIGSGGEEGVGSAIRIRGSSSLSMSNEPMLYVDGVRVSNSSSGSENGFQSSRINDINPADIQRIEILKGASAATLYGSEANGGIIQIFTKTGHAGEPEFSFSTIQTFSRSPKRFPGSYSYDSSTDEILQLNALNDNLEDSYGQRYNISVGGGSDEFQYYASTFFDNSTGIVPDTKFQKFGGRSNMKVFPNDNITLGLNIAYTHNERNTNPSYGHPSAFAANMMLASPPLVSEQRPNGEIFTPIDDILLVDIEQRLDNLFASGQINIGWIEGVNSKFIFGYNLIEDNNQELWPFGQAYYPKGRRMVLQRRSQVWTLDLNTSWETNISENINSSFLIGAQAFFTQNSFVNTEVSDLAGRGSSVLRGGATILIADEFIQEVKNAGLFLQEQLGFWDQLFLTFGVRFDGSSAFGEDLNTDTYPKVGASYTPKTDFLSFLSSLRLRGSYGESGMQPGAFDAQRTYTPTSFLDGQPGIRPENLGNKNLKPERSEELELGFDAGFVGNKINLNITYFTQKTTDALVAKQLPPSEGFLNPQLENVAEVSSQGVEFGIETRIIDRQNTSGLVRANISTIDQEVTDLGGASSFNVGESFRAINTITEGRQPGALMGTVVDPDDPYSIAVSLDQLNDIAQISANTLQNANGGNAQEFLGNALPTLTGNLFFDFSFGRFTTTATIAGAYGAVMWNEVDLLRNQLGLTKEVANIQNELKDPDTTNERKRELAERAAYLDFRVKGNWVDDADYIRLQDLSLGYKIPVEQLNLGSVNDLSVNLSFKNLFEITNYDGYGSPGTSGTDVTNTFNRNQDRFQLALPRIVQLKVKADF